MLDIAKHRLNDDHNSREFQGLTVAIPLSKMNLVKEKIRTFMAEINDEVSYLENPDTVIQIHCGAYQLTNS
jgi:hypothetical protein